MSKKTLVVFGATGKQGGSVVDSILSDKAAAAKYHIRAISRDAKKESAQALAARGAEVVTADLNDYKSVREAVRGAYGVFGVTNFWETLNMETEIAQGKRIADASNEEGVKHLVWSSLLNVKKLSGGVLPNVYHFDGKAEVEEYIRSLNIPATFFLAGFFMSNLPGASLRQMPDGKWGLALPMPSDAPIPLFAAEKDTGIFVKAIFNKPELTLGKRVYGATKYYTPTEILSGFKAMYPETGDGAYFAQLPHEAFKGILTSQGLPEPVQEEMLQNMRLIPEFGYYGGDSLDFSLGLLEEPPTTWENYIKSVPAFAGLK